MLDVSSYESQILGVDPIDVRRIVSFENADCSMENEI